MIGIDKFPRILKTGRILLTFSFVCFAWIFFRANNISDTYYIMTNLFKGLFDKDMLHFILNGFGYGTWSLIIAVSGIFFMETFHFMQGRFSISELLNRRSGVLRLMAYSGLLVIIIFFGNFSGNQFIYFQF